MNVVCVDLGGVMVRIRHDWGSIAGAAGIRSELGERLGRIADYAPLSLYQSGSISESEYLERLAEDLQTDSKAALVAHNAILEADYPGALEWVQQTKAGGSAVYCLSNTNALHYEAFFSGRFPVCEAFDHLLSSHIVGANKPDPAIYAALEQMAGACAGNVVFFDDTPANVAGALEVGWRAHLIDPDQDPIAQIRAVLG